MRLISTLCATLMGAALLSGSPASADSRCPPRDAAAGLCAPVHFVDSMTRSELLRRRAYEQGYRDALTRGQEPAPPPEIALDGKEGYSQSYRTQRRYGDRDRYGRGYYDEDDYEYNRRYYEREYERRLRRDGTQEVLTNILRGLTN